MATRTFLRGKYGRGKATFSDDLDDVAFIGDRVIPRLIHVTMKGGTAQPDLYMKIEVRHDVPHCTELSFTARPDGPEVRDKDLPIRVGDLTEKVVAMCSMKITDRGPHGEPTGWAWPREDRKALSEITRIRTHRPRKSREHYKKVADIYRQHFDAHPTAAVARAFQVSWRTAARYVQQARDEGLLPQTTTGKKQI